MDALDQQLLTRRIDHIERRLDRLIEVLTTPPVIIRTDATFTVEDVETLRETLRREPHKPVIVAGETRIERRAPVLQPEDFEGL